MPTANLGGTELHYVERGRGQVLVLLHAFPVDSRMWEAQIAELSSRCRVIAPDFRGFGQSQSADPFTTESLADDVHALLGQIGAFPCVLGGLSMGGYVALAYAKKYSSDLRGLILADTRAEGDSPEGKQGRQKMIELVRASGAKGVADQMVPKLLAPQTPQSRPAVAQALRAMIEACPPKTIEHALAALRDRPDQTQMLGSITIPTLIFVGDNDSLTPVSMSESMRQRIAGAELTIIKGAGHLSPMEQPAQVNQVILRFFSRL